MIDESGGALQLEATLLEYEMMQLETYSGSFVQFQNAARHRV